MQRKPWLRLWGHGNDQLGSSQCSARERWHALLELMGGFVEFQQLLREGQVCIALLLIRRIPRIGGELGGPKNIKYATGAVMVGLWFLYITFASLESYCIIQGF